MAGSQRYLRYILFAFICLVIFYFISSSSEIPKSSLPSPQDIFREQSDKWKSGTVTDPPVGAGYHDHDELSDTIESTELTDTSDSGSKSKKPYTPEKPASPYGDSKADSGRTSANNAATDPMLSGKLPSALELQYDSTSRPKMNATFVTLARNTDIWEIAKSIRHVEDRFNRNYHYDWVFLNDDVFDTRFKKVTTALVSGKTHYGLIPEEHWSFPDFIDQDKAEEVRKEMKEKKIIYGDSISYRHMCRYESGFFFRHPLMFNYEWYWRVEPSIEFFCDIAYDPFRFMADHGKKYGFVLSLYEYKETIMTLWDSVKKFIKNHPEHIVEGNSMEWISDDDGETYNHCHYWSNFEIGNLDWLRSPAYIDYFDSLDHDGGFFYERWGDAPVHSIGAALTLKKEEIHFFNDIAYYHVPFTHCPTGEQLRMDLKCHCDPGENFDWNGYSCLARYFEMNKIEKPEGYEDEH